MTQRMAILGLVVLFLAVSSSAYGDPKIGAHLSGAQEVTVPFVAPQPGVLTDTTGQFHVQFDAGFTSAFFRLNVERGVGITQAHLHCAPAGVNGPITVFLFGLVPAPGVDVNGFLSQGTLTNANFVAGVDCTPTCGRPVDNIASLHAAILDGCIYANVHSTAHPAGVVRGQVSP
jgi:hypothetical protein